MDDKALHVAIEKDNSITSGELSKQFNLSDEIVRLHMHPFSKTYSLSKWISKKLLDAHSRQLVAGCMSLHPRHRTGSINNQVLTSDEK